MTQLQKKQTDQEKKTIQALLSGTHPATKKYQGKHVMVVNDRVIPMPEGETSAQKYQQLIQKYGHPPTLTFIPRHNAAYVLCHLPSSNTKK